MYIACSQPLRGLTSKWVGYDARLSEEVGTDRETMLGLKEIGLREQGRLFGEFLYFPVS